MTMGSTPFVSRGPSRVVDAPNRFLYRIKRREPLWARLILGACAIVLSGLHAAGRSLRYKTPPMNNAFFGDHRARTPDDAGRGPATGVSSSLPKKPVPSGLRAGIWILAADSLVPPPRCFLAIRALAFVSALTVGLAWNSESRAGHGDAPHPDGPLPATTAVRPPASSPFARLVRIRPHRGRSIVPHFLSPHSNDPNDDTASDDPNDDDDNWDDLNADDDTDAPVVAWLPALVLYLIRSETAAAPTSTPPASLPFPTAQQLRC